MPWLACQVTLVRLIYLKRREQISRRLVVGIGQEAKKRWHLDKQPAAKHKFHVAQNLATLHKSQTLQWLHCRLHATQNGRQKIDTSLAAQIPKITDKIRFFIIFYVQKLPLKPYLKNNTLHHNLNFLFLLASQKPVSVKA